MLAPYSNHCLLSFLLFIVTSLLVAAQEIDRSNVNVNVNSVKLSALGRTARLGSLYNSQTEELSGISIFKSNIPPHLITKTDVPGTNTRYGVIKSYSDKSALLDVSASLTLSFLSGLISVTGAARFLSDEKKNSNSVIGSLNYETTTCEEIVEIFYDEILDYLNPAVLENATETHVVIGQIYGSQTLIKFEDTNSRNEAVSTIEARMGASLGILGFGISVDAQVGVGDTKIDTFSNYTIEIFGDLSLGTQDYPTNVTQVVKLIGRIPDLIKGKDKQLYFYLLPLETLRQFLKRSTAEKGHSLSLSLKSMSVSKVTEVAEVTEVKDGDGDGDLDLPESETSLQLQVFEEMSLLKQKVNDLYRSIMVNREILNDTDIHAVQNLKSRFSNLVSDFRSKLKRGILDYRIRPGFDLGKDMDRKTGINNLRMIKKEADSALEQLENTIDNDFQDIRLKIDLVDFLRSRSSSGSEPEPESESKSDSGSVSGSQVIWVGRQDSVQSTAVKLFRESGSLNFTICSMHFYRIYLKNTILFLNPLLESTRKNLTVLVVDCDFPKESCQLESSHIKTCSVIFEPPKQQQKNDLGSPKIATTLNQPPKTKPFNLHVKTPKNQKKVNLLAQGKFFKSDQIILNQFVKSITPLKIDN